MLEAEVNIDMKWRVAVHRLVLKAYSLNGAQGNDGPSDFYLNCPNACPSRTVTGN